MGHTKVCYSESSKLRIDRKHNSNRKQITRKSSFFKPVNYNIVARCFIFLYSIPHIFLTSPRNSWTFFPSARDLATLSSPSAGTSWPRQ
ncbi:LOW QUALITY PROTEIN: hypothetical protein PanWU01x14_104360 [Parasponia andersonii]|uniref:Uncharacterized protein n=1 Tax=Parasponia andersonii TaxID=3476 RepID=A0A2P5D1T7_PARAD|nr:LOW QUALITY PROTEIN: hypothetical protein PanWU01x14_104360 [Parasponia andersonii]